MIDGNPIPPPFFVNPAPDQAAAESACRAIASRGTDPVLPLYYDPGDPASSYLLDIPGQAQQAALDRLCRTQGSLICPPSAPDPDCLPVLERFAAALAELRFVRADHDPQAADLVWALPRIILAGGGWENHGPLAGQLGGYYPLCGLDPAEDVQAWTAAAHNARRFCGAPLGSAWLDYEALSGLMDPVPDPQAVTPSTRAWLDLLALLHVIKHTRHDPADGCVLITFRGQRSAVGLASRNPDEPLPPKAAVQAARLLCRNWTAPVVSKRHPSYHLPSLAIARILERLPPGRLLPMQEPRDALPLNVVIGPSPGLVPAPTNAGFVSAGWRLAGLWSAKHGTVRPLGGTPHEVASLRLPAGPADQAANADFAKVLPRQVSPQLPSAAIAQAFPNLITGPDPDAEHAVLDAVILSGLLPAHLFKHERPILACMPSIATVARSSNTGKTSLMVALGKLFDPRLDPVVATTSDAPTNRSLAASLRVYGTALLDEYRVPRSGEALMAETSLLSMVTGGARHVGRVLANDDSSVHLRYPLLMTTKVLDCKPDLLSRTIPLRLDPLPPTANTYQEIMSGRWSLHARLNALAFIDALDLAAVVSGFPPAQAAPQDGLRFERLRQLASVLLMLRAPIPAAKALDRVDRVAAQHQNWLEDYAIEAASSGLRASAGHQGLVRITPDSLFVHLDQPTMAAVFERGCDLQKPIPGAPPGSEVKSFRPERLVAAVTEAVGSSAVAMGILRDAAGGVETVPINTGVMALDYAISRMPQPDPNASTWAALGWKPVRGIHGLDGFVFCRSQERHTMLLAYVPRHSMVLGDAP